MKSMTSFSVTLLAILFSHNMCAKTVSVTNKTDDTLTYVTATFNFSGATGKKRNFKGKVTVNDLQPDKTATLNSNDAIYKGGKAIDQNPTSAVLEKIEAGSMRIPKTNIGLGGAQEDVEGHDITRFNVVTKKNKLGLSYYDIEPVKSFF